MTELTIQAYGGSIGYIMYIVQAVLAGGELVSTAKHYNDLQV